MNPDPGTCSALRADGRPCRNASRERTGRCGYHDGSRQATDLERDRAAFVAQWRSSHPTWIYTQPWACPLCGEVVQTATDTEGKHPGLQRDRIAAHQGWHGADWQRWTELGGE